jgi:UDP-N-acetyl-D-glucosamine dehydrogenase
MAHFVVGKVRKALNAERKAVNGSRVLVLGVAYKRDVDDIRESPSLDIIRELERDGADVLFHDPHVSSFEEDGRTRTGVELTNRVLESVDVVLLVTDHSAFDLDWILDRARVLVDSRNATSAAVRKRGMKRSMGWIVKSQSDRMTSRESSALSE